MNRHHNTEGRSPRGTGAVVPDRRRGFLALVAVTAVWGVAIVPWSHHGMNWSDTGQLFHFGSRILRDDIPYRDFAYQSGWLGITADAAFQRVFGAGWMPGLAARLLVNLAALLVFFATLRRFVTPFTAVGVAAGVALVTPLYLNEVLHNGDNNNWASLLVLAAVAFLVRGTPRHTAAAGIVTACILAARQSNGVLCLVVSFGVVALFAGRDPRRFLRPVALPFVLGAAAAIAVLALGLASRGALGAAMTELFTGAAEKKAVSPLPGIVNMLSGGLSANASGAQILRLVVLPLLGAGAVIAIAAVRRGGPDAARASGDQETGSTTTTDARHLLVLPALAVVGLLLFPWEAARPVALLFTNEIPRTLFTLLLIGSCLAPGRVAAATGLPHPTFPLVVALVLASVWARKLSFFGPHDVPYDLWVMLVPLLACMAPSLSPRAKAVLSGTFAAAGAILFLGHLATGRLGTNDGTIRDARVPLDHPLARGVLVTPEKAGALSELRAHVQPGDTCFIYGSASPLYTLLGCENPTRLDVTFSDAFTAEQAREAVAALHASPPDWIIEATNLHSAAIARPFDGSVRFYGPHGQEAPRILHEGLREMQRDYRQLFAVHQRLPRESVVRRDWEDWDDVLNLRLHRRRDLERDDAPRDR